jgi:Transposase DDE domain
MQVSFTKSYAAAKYARLLIFAPQPRSRYRLRKQIVEPVFGQIKQARGFRQFLLRGLEAVQAEWALICTAHNITKLAKAI